MRGWAVTRRSKLPSVSGFQEDGLSHHPARKRNYFPSRNRPADCLVARKPVFAEPLEELLGLVVGVLEAGATGAAEDVLEAVELGGRVG